MSAHGGGGIGSRMVFGAMRIVAGCACVLAVLAVILGGNTAVAFAKTASSALGTGFGVAFGAIPSFVSHMKTAQQATSGNQGGEISVPDPTATAPSNRKGGI